MESKRLFVLIRDDLKNEAYKAVQAGHAVAEFMLKYPEEWLNSYLIYVRVRDEERLSLWSKKALLRNYPFAVFTEPDQKHEATAMACLPDNQKFFDKLQVLE